MAKCTYCEKKIEMRPNAFDEHNKVKRPRMEWVYVRDIRWTTEIQRDHFVVEFDEELNKEIVIGEQDHYIGDEAPPISHWEWYLEEHPELSN